MGNPLLDISIEADDDALLKKYGLTIGMSDLATEKQMGLFDEVFNHPNVSKMLGGAALNTTRACAYALR